jgi:hypothetical protein
MPDDYRRIDGNRQVTTRYLKWLGIISLSILLLGYTTSLALNVDEQQVVQGIGAIIKRNQATARSRAINNALRKALEQALLTTLDPLELIDNAHTLETTLYARALTYIRSYRVLWEYPDVTQSVYRVGIEVSLATDEVNKTIQALGLAQSDANHGRVLVLITEHRLQRSHLSSLADNDGVVAQTLRHYFESHNFQTVRLVADATWDGQASTALMAAKRAGAEVVLIGQASAEKVRSDVAGMPLQTVHASVQVQALATATGKRLAMEHVEATALHIDAVLGGTHALRKAAVEVASRLEPQLRKHFVVYGKVNIP